MPRFASASAVHVRNERGTLAAGGRTLGVMSFVASVERPYRDEDLAFAQDLGHHAALVLARGVTVA